jgi:hypothetical protein
VKDITLDNNLIEYLASGMIDEGWDDKERRRVVNVGARFVVEDGKLYCMPGGRFGKRWVPPIAERKVCV